MKSGLWLTVDKDSQQLNEDPFAFPSFTTSLLYSAAIVLVLLVMMFPFFKLNMKAV